MSDKMTRISIALIVLLVLTAGGLSFWSSSLSGRINSLNDEVQAFKADTASQFDTTNDIITGVDSRLSGFQTETANHFSNVEYDINNLDTALTDFKADTANKFTATQNSIDTITSDLTTLGNQFTESTMNARQVYDNVINSVCMIYGDTGSGSGFVYSSDGYIITAWHVIDGQSNIYVILHDGSFARATVVGSDQYSDVAVLRISKSGLTPVPVADSSSVVPGEPVIVIGNPYATFETVTYGVVSRTNYYTLFPGGNWLITNLIQYDAPTNPGNSGGPVFDKEGKVIGIVSLGGGNDMNYAVSSNKVKRVAQAILDYGFFTNATLPGTWGISDMTPVRAVSLGVDTALGVWFSTAIGVGQVRSNDVVIAVDGVLVRDIADLFSYIAEFKSPDDTIMLTLIRNGVEMQASVTLIPGWIFLVS